MIEPDDIPFAKKLRELRIRSNKIQFQVALELGLRAQRVLSEYESGKRHFTEEFIEKICNYFKIPLGSFPKSKAGANIRPYVWSRSTERKVAEPLAQNDEEIKLLLLRKENVELKLEKLKLEAQLKDALCKLKALTTHSKPAEIHVII